MIYAIRFFLYFRRINVYQGIVVATLIMMFWGICTWLAHTHLKGLAVGLNIYLLTLVMDVPAEGFAIFLRHFLAPAYAVSVLMKPRRSEMRDGFRSLVEHFVNSDTRCNLYANLIFSKLHPAHSPQPPSAVAETGFSFLRHVGDFYLRDNELAIDDAPRKLKEYQASDFRVIASCVRRKWKTVAYGDMSVLLHEPAYFAQIRSLTSRTKWRAMPRPESRFPFIAFERVRRISVKRLFVFPYVPHGTTPVEETELIKQLAHLELPDSETADWITARGASQWPLVRLDDVEKSVRSAQVSEGDATTLGRVLGDTIYLTWLVQLHRDFEIDCRILPRWALRAFPEGMSLSEELLSNFIDEGSALLDNVVVRFDDQQEDEGFIHYKFLTATNKVDQYEKAFDLAWSHDEAMPGSDLKALLLRFFSEATTASILSACAPHTLRLREETK